MWSRTGWPLWNSNVPSLTVFNVDGSPNETGSITEIVNVILCYDGHTECTSFTVTSLGKQDIILGFTWLQEYNLEIDWWTQEVVMSWCPTRCHMDQSKVWKKHQECQRVEWLIQTCHSGPHPLLLEEELEADSTPDSDVASKFCSSSNSDIVCCSPEDTLAEGDHLLYMNLAPEAEHICASATTIKGLWKLCRSIQGWKWRSHNTYKSLRMSLPKSHSIPCWR